jgi:hypothetical protein
LIFTAFPILACPRVLSGGSGVLKGVLDKGVASFLASMGFDGGAAAGRGAGGTSSGRLLKILIMAVLPFMKSRNSVIYRPLSL